MRTSHVRACGGFLALALLAGVTGPGCEKPVPPPPPPASAEEQAKAALDKALAAIEAKNWAEAEACLADAKAKKEDLEGIAEADFALAEAMAAAEAKEKAAQLVGQAKECLAAKDWNGAKAKADEALALDDANAEAPQVKAQADAGIEEAKRSGIGKEYADLRAAGEDAMKKGNWRLAEEKFLAAEQKAQAGGGPGVADLIQRARDGAVVEEANRVKARDPRAAVAKLRTIANPSADVTAEIQRLERQMAQDEQREKAAAAVREAQALLARGQYQQAIGKAREAEGLARDDRAIAGQAANIVRQAELELAYADAIDKAKKALAANDPKAASDHAREALRRKNTAEAKSLYNRAQALAIEALSDKDVAAGDFANARQRLESAKALLQGADLPADLARVTEKLAQAEAKERAASYDGRLEAARKLREEGKFVSEAMAILKDLVAGRPERPEAKELLDQGPIEAERAALDEAAKPVWDALLKEAKGLKGEEKVARIQADLGKLAGSTVEVQAKEMLAAEQRALNDLRLAQDFATVQTTAKGHADLDQQIAYLEGEAQKFAESKYAAQIARMITDAKNARAVAVFKQFTADVKNAREYQLKMEIVKAGLENPKLAGSRYVALVERQRDAIRTAEAKAYFGGLSSRVRKEPPDVAIGLLEEALKSELIAGSSLYEPKVTQMLNQAKGQKKEADAKAAYDGLKLNADPKTAADYDANIAALTAVQELVTGTKTEKAFQSALQSQQDGKAKLEQAPPPPPATE